jgi:hypothetical protein
MTATLHAAGAALIAGSAAFAGAVVLVSRRPVIAPSLPPDVAALLLVAAILLIPSLPAMLAVQADQVGVAGLSGYVLLSTGLLLPVLAAAPPLLLHRPVDAPIGEGPIVFVLGIALTVGLLLTGITTFQAAVLPHSAAVLMLAATAGFFVAFFVAEFLPPVIGQVAAAAFGILLALGFAWIGLGLWQVSSR